jgi:hypothetical protein
MSWLSQSVDLLNSKVLTQVAIFIHEEVNNISFNCTEEEEWSSRFYYTTIYLQVEQKVNVTYSTTSVRLTHSSVT